jgi:hypothetical protein
MDRSLSDRVHVDTTDKRTYRMAGRHAAWHDGHHVQVENAVRCQERHIGYERCLQARRI